MPASLKRESGTVVMEDHSGLDWNVWDRRSLLLLVCVLAVRIAYLWSVPFDLVHDEAYYWDWSRRLDFGYYSKPPMVAWLIALSTAVGGSSAFFVRLPAVFLTTGGLLFVYLLGRRMFDPARGFWATVLAACAPGNAALSLIMTIDAPLMFFWSGTLFAFWCMLEPRRNGRWTCVSCAVLLGLGMLSKQTMLAFPPLALLFLATSQQDRTALRSPRTWITALAGIAFMAPVIVWNYQHDWVTWTHTSEHFSTESVSLTRRIVRGLEFLGSQLAILSPVTWVWIAGALLTMVRQWPRIQRPQRFLLCFSGVPLAGVVALSLHQRVEANWPAPFYVAGFLLIVGSLPAGIPGMRKRERKDGSSDQFRACPQVPVAPSAAETGPGVPAFSGWLKAATIAGIASIIVTYALPFVILACGLKGSPIDATVRMWGWHELGTRVGPTLETLPGDPLLVVNQLRGTASELAFYIPSQPDVHVYNDTGKIISQYDVWGGPSHKALGRDALIVCQGPECPAGLANLFSRVEKIGPVVVPIGERRELAYHLWRGRTLRTWPGRRPVASAPPNTLQR